MKRIFLLLPLTALAAEPADSWHRERRVIDMHVHLGGSRPAIERAARILDRAGVGVGVNLSGGTVTRKEGTRSQFEKITALAEGVAPGRFVHYMNLDYGGWDAPDFSERAARQIEEGRRLGAAGLKEYKRLGLFLRDGAGKLIAIDDPKLDAVWAKCGELGMPVSIHVADPRAFWLPYDDKNERWTELKDHKSWWFGDPAKHPSREELLAALDRVIARHPKTKFVCVHFANNAEDIAWVEQRLDERPNMLADLAARIPEVGRHAPDKVRALFEKHPRRILFATDFMSYDKLILGSGGDADNPTDEDAAEFFAKCRRWLETNDRDWPHMTPIQGDWTISSIGLPADIQRRVYFDNARELLARSLPLPSVTAARIARDFAPDGRLDEPEWKDAQIARIEQQSSSAEVRTSPGTTVRVLWSDSFLYLGYECRFTKLSTFEPPQRAERVGLWENDVVEAFIAPDPAKPGEYSEYEWAPNGDWLDLSVTPEKKDFGWDSRMEHAATVDDAARVWRVEARIPFAALAVPQPGAKWRVNFYRHDKASRSGLAFNPTLTGTFHTPARFGWLVFGK